jgi:GPH family glycoside/pentoside/hexuronide:cation symporter
MTQPRRSGLTLALFAGPCVPLAALGLPLVVYLPEYYANELGLGLGVVGVIFTWVRLADVGLDPLLGALMDRTNTRFGRFKPWLLLGGPLLFASAWMLFFATKGVGPARLWIWLPVAYAAFSICVLAQTAWGSLLSSDYNQRSRVYGWWQGANVVGILLALRDLLGEGRAASVKAMGLFIVVTTPIFIGLALWKAPEPRAPTNLHGATLKDYGVLFANGSVRRILGIDALIGISAGVTGALFFFFFERVKGFSDMQTGLLILAYFISALGFAGLWAKLAKTLQKHGAVALASALCAIFQGGIVFIPDGNFPIALVAVILAGLPYSACALILRAMTADAGDEIRLQTGVDRTGLLYALLAGTSKLGYAVSVGATFPILAAAGFSATGAGDPSQGLGMLTALYGFGPFVLAALAIPLALGYRLDAQRHAQILAALPKD